MPRGFIPWSLGRVAETESTVRRLVSGFNTLNATSPITGWRLCFRGSPITLKRVTLFFVQLNQDRRWLWTLRTICYSLYYVIDLLFTLRISDLDLGRNSTNSHWAFNVLIAYGKRIDWKYLPWAISKKRWLVLVRTTLSRFTRSEWFPWPSPSEGWSGWSFRHYLYANIFLNLVSTNFYLVRFQDL